MKRAGVTMRVDNINGEWRMAVDEQWPLLLGRLGFEAVLLPHTGPSGRKAIEDLALDALLLTGGNDVLPDGPGYHAARQEFEMELLDVAAEKNLPVAGVCRGMQVMNLHAGGRVCPQPGHVGKEHAVTWHGAERIVNSYHNYGVTTEDLGTGLKATGRAGDGTIEAFVHETLPWAAVMWHPERPIQNPALHQEWLGRALEGHAA